MTIIFHITLSILITIAVYFAFLLGTLPPTLQEQSFLEILPFTYRGLIGSLVAGFILSATLIQPKLRELFNYLKTYNDKSNEKFDFEPIEEKCIIDKIEIKNDHTLITVSYGSHCKLFNYKHKDIHSKLEKGNRITVFYNPKNPDDAYLDFQAPTEN